MRLAAAVTVVAGLAGTARATAVHGLVFDDANGDGRVSPGERGVAHAVVAYDVVRFAVTDERGAFAFDLPDDASGIAWARVPEGFAPGPAWARVDAARGAAVEIALHRLASPVQQPFSIVVAADTHLSPSLDWGFDLGRAAADAVSMEPPPAFFTILGDVTQGNTDAQFALVDASLDGLGVPYVPVPGNHDWWDGGVAWFAHYGPDNYSFDLGGVHFVVWNLMMLEDDIRNYLGAELARVDRRMPIVALTHAPPSPAVVETLRELGVAYVLTGHAHTNRVVDHDGVIELNTEPLLMGGLDFTPAGYRVVTIDRGRIASVHHTIVDERAAAPPRARWSATIGGNALAAGPVIANGVAYVSATDLADGATGGVVAIDLATGAQRWRAQTQLAVRGAPAVARGVVAVAQIDGVVIGLDAKTGSERWRYELAPGAPPQTRATLAGPVADDGEFLVGNQRELAALDAQSGAARWRTVPVADGNDSQSLAQVAVGAGLAIGAFHRALGGIGAWDRATGALVWRLDGEEAVGVNAAPLVDARGNTAFVATGMDEVIALDLDDGAERWRVKLDPAGFDWGNATVGAPALAEGVLVVPTLYRDLVALDAATGAELWRYEGAPSAIRETHYRGARERGFASSPVIANGVVWAADTAGNVDAIELRTGHRLERIATGAPVLAGLAISGDVLLVASYDGVLRAFSTRIDEAAEPKARRRAGCCDASGGDASPLLAGLVFWSRRRRRRLRWWRQARAKRAAGGYGARSRS